MYWWLMLNQVTLSTTCFIDTLSHVVQRLRGARKSKQAAFCILVVLLDSFSNAMVVSMHLIRGYAWRYTVVSSR
ncbi:hypothetical protein V8C34DRAFT_162991 [Trichoderma compactum]